MKRKQAILTIMGHGMLKAVVDELKIDAFVKTPSVWRFMNCNPDCPPT